MIFCDIEYAGYAFVKLFGRRGKVIEKTFAGFFRTIGFEQSNKTVVALKIGGLFYLVEKRKTLLGGNRSLIRNQHFGAEFGLKKFDFVAPAGKTAKPPVII